MPVHTTADGTSLVYDDWGTGRPVVLVHGWSLDATTWEHQVAALTAAGLRCITYDRRGHGRSEDPGHGYDADTLADDLAGLPDTLDLHDAVLGPARQPTGERGRLVSSLTPYALATDVHPLGIPR